ncbi:MAG: ribosome biogenesis GTPase Der [Alphaproteobacteria bacterium]
MRLKVAIVGRPNVGKSTLFNRLAGKRLALVDDTPGLTRDRREAPGRLPGLDVDLIDTAGFEEAEEGALESRMRAQTEAAIADADVSIFLIDARAGVTPYDRTFASILRKAGKPVVLAANKCEGKAAEPGLIDAFSLGFGEPIALSAEHGLGIRDLIDALEDVAATLPQGDEAPEPDDESAREGRALNLAIVGRPNVGKSTLINTALGEERLITGPEAGITRDSISVPFEIEGRKINLYDTAGMRRRARVQDKLEKLSVGDTLKAIKFADVVVLLMDAQDAFEKQDLQIADLVEREGRAIVLAVNKWDLVDDRKAALEAFKSRAERMLPQLAGVELVTLSGMTGEGLKRLMKAVMRAYTVWQKRIPTSQLNKWLQTAIERHPPPAAKGRRIKIKYMTQVKGRPPTFVIFCQRAGELPNDYLRYLTSGIRERFEFPGTPIRLELRSGENPYADK